MLKKWKAHKKNNDYGERSGFLKSQSVLIFDIMFLFRSHFIRNEAMSERGIPIGGVKGTLDKIYWLTKKFNSKTIICVFDGKDSHDKRQAISEDYKSNRDKSKRGLSNPFLSDPDKNDHNREYQMDLLVKILTEMPVKLIIHKRLEADDIIAYLTKQYYENEGGVRIIVSRDQDFYQLIDNKTSVYDPTAKRLITSKSAGAKWDTNIPSNIIYYRCIEGDKSDNVKGIHGVGTKTIQKYFPELKNTKIKTIDAFINLIKSKEDELDRLQTTRRISEGIDIIRMNHELMQLQEVNIGSDAKSRILSAMKSNEFDYKGKYKLQKIVEQQKVSKALKFDRLKEFYDIIRVK